MHEAISCVVNAVIKIYGCDILYWQVLVSTCDKASQNQRLIRLHGVKGNELTYKVRNFFAQDRDLFFMSDVPHLIKTVRNNLASSGSTNHLWVSYVFNLIDTW